MSAILNYKRSNDDRVGDLLRRDEGVRGAMRRRGQTPRDHARANVDQIRRTQRANREARDERAALNSARRPFKLKQFENVESKVAKDLRTQSRAGTASGSAGARAGSGSRRGPAQVPKGRRAADVGEARSEGRGGLAMSRTSSRDNAPSYRGDTFDDDYTRPARGEVEYNDDSFDGINNNNNNNANDFGSDDDDRDTTAGRAPQRFDDDGGPDPVSECTGLGRGESLFGLVGDSAPPANPVARDRARGGDIGGGDNRNDSRTDNHDDGGFSSDEQDSFFDGEDAPAARRRAAGGKPPLARGAAAAGGARTSLRSRVTKPSVPSKRELRERDAQLESRASRRAEVDYIRSNQRGATRPSSKTARSKAVKLPAVRNPDVHDPREINPDFGRVPRYVREREAKRAADEAAAQAAAKAALECPPGMRLLPDDERLDTLGILLQTQKQVNADLGALPIVLSTYRMQRRKAELEAKLDEVEAAVKTFSRAKVYVADD